MNQPSPTTPTTGPVTDWALRARDGYVLVCDSRETAEAEAADKPHLIVICRPAGGEWREAPPAAAAPRPSFAEQEPAVSALAAMAEAFGHLPPAHITVSQPDAGGALHIQMRTPAAFEAWREALGLDAQGVVLRSNGGDAWLRVEGAFSGGQVELSGHGLTDPELLAEGRAAEQRHQLEEDPATEAAFAALAATHPERCTPAADEDEELRAALDELYGDDEPAPAVTQ